MTLLICRTCPRYDTHNIRTFGPKMLEALATTGANGNVRITGVACVGGCPNPGNVALDSVGKPRVRFSGLTENDAGALVQAAAAYEASNSGEPTEWMVPGALAGKITAISPKR